MSNSYEVTGRDKAGNVTFHVAVEAPTEQVARLYATGHLQRTVDGAEAVHKTVKIEVRLLTASSTA